MLELRVSEISNQIGCRYSGKDRYVTGVKYVKYASENEIAIVTKYDDLKGLGSKVVLNLTRHSLLLDDLTVIDSDCDYDETLVRIGHCFVKYGIYEDFTKVLPIMPIQNSCYAGENVKIGEGVELFPFVTIGQNVTIGDNCVIESNVYIGSNVIIGNGVVIHSGAKIGIDAFYHSSYINYRKFAGIGTVCIGDNVEIGCNTVIQRGTFSDTEIGNRCVIGNQVEIGHDVKIGTNCKIVSQTGIAGNAEIGDSNHIYGQVAIINNVKTGEMVEIKAKSLVTKDVPDGSIISGLFGRPHIEEYKLQAKIRRLFLKKGD